MHHAALRLLPLDQKYSDDRDGYGGYDQPISNRVFSDRGGYGRSILNRFFNVFLTSTSYSFIVYFLLKYVTSFWWLILFFIDKFFNFSLKSVICKKYTNTNVKDRKHTNAIDISIM